MNELISIVVPVYNAEKTLEHCISALVEQTHNNIEIILVNDGSKDHSLEICYHFAERDPRILVINKPNGGVSSARNAGLDVAKGEFIMFCDSDDWADPDWCECLLESYSPNNLVMCEFVEVDSFSEKNMQCSIANVELIDRADFIRYRKKGIGSPTTKIFCRNIIEKYHIRFPEELFLGEDLLFVLEYMNAITGSIIYVHKELYNYYVVNLPSLSKRSPSFEQCDLFFKMLSCEMYKLNAQDDASVQIRDNIVLCDYEKAFIHMARSTDHSLIVKLHQVSKVRNYKSFRECSRKGTVSNNALLMSLYRRRWVGLLIIFYTLKNKKIELESKCL